MHHKLLLRLGNPLEWDQVSKGILLNALSGPLYIGYSFLAIYYLHNHEDYPDFDRVVLSEHIVRLIVMVMLTATLGIAGLRLRRSHPDSLLYQHASVQFYAIGMSLLGYYSGSMSISAGIVLMGGPMLGLIFFDRRVVIPGFLSALAVLSLVTYLSGTGHLPYLPILKKNADFSGVYPHYWAVAQLLFAAPHVVVILVLTQYVLGQWRQREQEVRRLSATDPLTGVANRRQIMELLDKEVSRTRRHGPPLSLIMLDLDHFKQINDRYGHQIGDRVLQASAAVLRDTIRQCDVAGRYGGEEFVIMLPDTGIDGAAQVAERCRKCIAETTVLVGGGSSFSISASLGVSSNEGRLDIDAEELIREADVALYLAKNQGRNRVMVSAG